LILIRFPNNIVYLSIRIFMYTMTQTLAMPACLSCLISAAWAGMNDHSFIQSAETYSAVTGTGIISSGTTNNNNIVSGLNTIFSLI